MNMSHFKRILLFNPVAEYDLDILLHLDLIEKTIFCRVLYLSLSVEVRVTSILMRYALLTKFKTTFT